MTMSVGTYSVLSLKRARICFRQLSQARRRWAGAPLQQERRSQCVTSRVQLSHQLLPARHGVLVAEIFPSFTVRRRRTNYFPLGEGSLACLLRIVDPGECRDGLTILT